MADDSAVVTSLSAVSSTHSAEGAASFTLPRNLRLSLLEAQALDSIGFLSRTLLCLATSSLRENGDLDSQPFPDSLW